MLIKTIFMQYYHYMSQLRKIVLKIEFWLMRKINKREREKERFLENTSEISPVDLISLVKKILPSITSDTLFPPALPFSIILFLVFGGILTKNCWRNDIIAHCRDKFPSRYHRSCRNSIRFYYTYTCTYFIASLYHRSLPVYSFFCHSLIISFMFFSFSFSNTIVMIHIKFNNYKN